PARVLVPGSPKPAPSDQTCRSYTRAAGGSQRFALHLALPMRLLFRMIAALPLRIVQALGVALARVAFALSTRERNRLDQNLRHAGYDDPALRSAAIAEAGKTLLEMPWLWTRPQTEVVNLVRDVEAD